MTNHNTCLKKGSSTRQNLNSYFDKLFRRHCQQRLKWYRWLIQCKLIALEQLNVWSQHSISPLSSLKLSSASASIILVTSLWSVLAGWRWWVTRLTWWVTRTGTKLGRTWAIVWAHTRIIRAAGTVCWAWWRIRWRCWWIWWWCRTIIWWCGTIWTWWRQSRTAWRIC